MILGMLARLSRVWMTLGYAATLVAVSVALVVLGPRVHDRVVGLASTNLHNLARGHLGTLFGSAFVTDAGPMYFWLPGLVCLLALAELIWHRGRLALVFVTGHIGATLLVAIGLTAAIELRWLPLSISRASDVGVSYGAVAVVGALTAAVPRRWKPAWLGWWVPVAIAAAVLSDDFTDVGHTIALALGLLVSTRLAGPAQWTPVRYALLAVGGSFGFLMLVHGEWTTLIAGAVGLLGAVAAVGIARSRAARRRVPEAALAAAEPALNT
jgi:multisubunit Na+/H+ antiporter MnhF subunit